MSRSAMRAGNRGPRFAGANVSLVTRHGDDEGMRRAKSRIVSRKIVPTCRFLGKFRVKYLGLASLKAANPPALFVKFGIDRGI